MEKALWKANWGRGDAIPGGNQGHTFLARRHGDPEDIFAYVLKYLKRQNDPARRARMHVEVARAFPETV